MHASTTAVIAWQTHNVFTAVLLKGDFEGGGYLRAGVCTDPVAIVASRGPVGDIARSAGGKAIGSIGEISLRRQEAAPQTWEVVIRRALRMRGIVPDRFFVDRTERRARIPISINRRCYVVRIVAVRSIVCPDSEEPVIGFIWIVRSVLR